MSDQQPASFENEPMRQVIQTWLETLPTDLVHRHWRYQVLEKLLYVIALITIIVAAYVFYLIYKVTTDMHLLTHYTATIAEKITPLAQNVRKIQVEMANMNQAMTATNDNLHNVYQVTVEMNQSLEEMRFTMENVKNSTLQVSKDMNTTQKSILQVAHDITNMQQSMLQVAQNITNIHQDFEQVVKNLDNMVLDVGEMRGNTALMSQELGVMSNDMGVLSHQVSRSFRTFNQVMPMPW